MMILVKLIARVPFQTQERQTHIALIGVLAIDGMQPESFFRQVTTHGKKGRSCGRKKIGHVHHHFGLRVGFQHVQHIVAQDGVELSFRIFRPVIIVIPHNVISLPFQFVCVKSIPATKIQNASLQQTVLKQITGRRRKAGALDGGQVRMVYFSGSIILVSPGFKAHVLGNLVHRSERTSIHL